MIACSKCICWLHKHLCFFVLWAARFVLWTFTSTVIFLKRKKRLSFRGSHRRHHHWRDQHGSVNVINKSWNHDRPAGLNSLKFSCRGPWSFDNRILPSFPHMTTEQSLPCWGSQHSICIVSTTVTEACWHCRVCNRSLPQCFFILTET